jgi:hypothetical protein
MIAEKGAMPKMVSQEELVDCDWLFTTETILSSRDLDVE